METTHHPQELPKWLKRVQEESWQAEIILSGMVIFSLFQIPEGIEKLREHFITEVVVFNDFNNFFVAWSMGSVWLTIGFVVHLILRGVWIAMVGLSYVFPEGTRKEVFRTYQPRFYETIRKLPSPTESVIKLEKACSIIFAISFFFFMVLVGVSFYYIVLGTGVATFFIYLEGYDVFLDKKWIFELFFGSLSLLVFIDFLSFGYFRRFKVFAVLFYPVYVLISWVTFSKTYRNIYYLLASNVNRWKLGFLLAGFIFMTILLSSSLSGNSFKLPSRLEFYSTATATSVFAGHYQTNHHRLHSVKMQIPSEIIENNYLQLFIVQRIDTEDSIKVVCNYEEQLAKEKINRDSLKLACLGSFYRVTLNDSIPTNPNWHFYQNPTTQQKGIMSWLDISALPNGEHKLLCEIMLHSGPRYYSEIKFVKDVD